MATARKTAAEKKVDAFDAEHPAAPGDIEALEETTAAPQDAADEQPPAPAQAALEAAPANDSDAFASMFADGEEIPESDGVIPAPTIYWHNGKVSTRKDIPSTPGDFYSDAGGWGMQPGHPWKVVERFERGSGYAAECLKIAVILYRSQPFMPIKDANGQVIGREFIADGERWQPGMSILTELLCFVEGYEGLVRWSVKGMTGKAVTGKGGIVPTYRAGLLASASAKLGRALPLGAFWLPIATARRADGGIAFEDTGFKSYTTPPALFLPPNPMSTLYVGHDKMRKAAELARQYEAWSKQRRASEYYEQGASAAAALPPGREPRNPVTTIDQDEF